MKDIVFTPTVGAKQKIGIVMQFLHHNCSGGGDANMVMTSILMKVMVLNKRSFSCYDIAILLS